MVCSLHVHCRPQTGLVRGIYMFYVWHHEQAWLKPWLAFVYLSESYSRWINLALPEHSIVYLLFVCFSSSLIIIVMHMTSENSCPALVQKNKHIYWVGYLTVNVLLLSVINSFLLVGFRVMFVSFISCCSFCVNLNCRLTTDWVLHPVSVFRY